MTRSLRIEYPGAFYHVFSRGVAKQIIYQSDEDRIKFLDFLKITVKRHNWILHAYCLMDNHFHLLVETPDPSLSAGMHLLNGLYAQWYNIEHDRVGHLFQGRYGHTLIEKEEYFLEAAAYIVLNPVKAQLVQHPSLFQWSSYASTAGHRDTPGWLTTSSILACFSNDLQEARLIYREFVDVGIDDDISRQIESGGVCGSAEFCSQVQNLIKDKREVKDIPRRHRFAGRPPIGHILDGWGDLHERNERIIKAVQEYGYMQKEVGDHLELAPSTISTVVNGAVSSFFSRHR